MAEKSEIERVLSLVTNEELKAMFKNAGYDDDDDIPPYLLSSFAITLLGDKNLSEIKTKEEFMDFFQLYCHINYPTVGKLIEYCNSRGINNPNGDELWRAFDELYSRSGIPYPNPHPYTKKENIETEPKPLLDNDSLESSAKSRAKSFRERIRKALGSDCRPIPPKGFETHKKDRGIELE